MKLQASSVQSYSAPLVETELTELTDMPDYVKTVPHVLTRCPEAEIQRSIKVLRWIESLDVRDLTQSRPPQNTSDLVSVVVPMYNATQWIDICLKGLLAQTHSNLEIFCIDDASEDDTYERVVERFGGDRRLCVLKLSKNVGPYQIKNWVISSLAKGKLIAFQDADDVSHPTRMEEQRGSMLRWQHKICGTSVHQFFPPHITPQLKGTVSVEENGALHSVLFYPTVERMSEPRNVRHILRQRYPGIYTANRGSIASYGGQMIDRSVFLEFGGFDGRTRILADKQFNCCLLRFSDVGNVPKVLYSRRLHERSITQHPLTTNKSPAWLKYYLTLEMRQEAIRQELLKGNMNSVREMCTADLFCDDIRVEECHAGFDLAV